ncbi:alanine--glyoxylate aminotransferase-like [Epargyreus clarus]|uniref:alanine--glyoxylate aminotransferase-like n=1 Tax=Epargyreus clarus TaxID=520877 RepID=UPI003C2D0D37
MSSPKMILEPPMIVDRQFKTPLFCGPGPCNLWPSVQEALSRPVITPLCDEYFNVVDDIRKSLQYVFQTRSNLVLALSGSGHIGMETVISNLVAPGETLLIAARGLWDERASIVATRHGIKVEAIKIPMNATFSLEQIEPELRRLRPTALFITHGDSSTGTVQNLEGLGDLCRKYDALLLVDTVVSLGGVPFYMDEWKVDAVYSSSQKALSGPAGISPVAFSTRAEAKINSRTHESPFYFDVKLLAQQWNCYGNTRFYHHTLSPPLMWALRSCLKELCIETLPKSWARHAAATALLHKKLKEFGFEFFVPKPEDRLPTVTTIVLPKEYPYPKFIAYMRDNFGILVFGGLGLTAGKTLRVGIMGVNSTLKTAEAVANAMINTMKGMKKSSL